MYLLDTDSYTHLRQQRPSILSKVEQAVTQGDVVATTIVTKMEILQGRMAALIKADSHERFLEAQLRLLDDETHLNGTQIMLLNEASLGVFDSLLPIRGLRKIGRPDLLMASIVRAMGATLVTRDLKHFKLVPQLKLENWVD